MKKRPVGNLLALAVLSYLSRQPMHPYELAKTLRSHGDARSIKFNHGSLYMVVQQLAKAGFVAEQEVNRDGARPERTVYQITDAGRAELRDWLRELVGQPQHEYPAFVSALSLISALSPNEVVPLLRARLVGIAEQRAAAQSEIDAAEAQGLPALFLIEEVYRVGLLDAEAAFVADLIGKITDPEKGWGPMWAAAHGEEYRAE
ncbi:PadR family transcriptional regulator [Dactylosporangium matsuzakiense]|uniref:PadR family transcriptional regulator n=1 Tax=Dactylosporangium matsuzakiense TaxID=53360 RepID=A0A9W6KHK1_9ACTN|nr:PadR family transcriptional regulator [Dactylosporangium matsuzakiense]UWZ47529.1 helix-turn-helix transcriptional regulator [Dactylosporangium matsuzakiense]GLL01643.1 PadR family transcriptional regulator [Dactylosporangium matsuzakiense]